MINQNPDERGISKAEQITRLRAELDRFKPQPMSQFCRDGKHNGTGDNRCLGCYCLCHNQDAEMKHLLLLEQRWSALRDHLTERHQHQRKVCDRLIHADSDSIAAMAAAQCIWQTYESALAKMRELEAGR